MSHDTIKDLTSRWLSGWDIGDQPFNGAVFRDLFEPGDGAISVFDNVAGDVLVLNNVDQYVATWEPFMAPMTHWSVHLEGLEIIVSGDLAFTTFKLVGNDTRGPNSEVIPFGQYGTHVWKRSESYGWRIIHEHLTAYDRLSEG